MDRQEASWLMVLLASSPQLPYVTTASGIQTQPNSSPFGSLAVCFLASAAKAAAHSVVPASDMEGRCYCEVKCSWLSQFPVIDQDISRAGMAQICRKTTAHLDPDP